MKLKTTATIFTATPIAPNRFNILVIKKTISIARFFKIKKHAKYLKEFLAKSKIEATIIPLVTTITRGTWKVKNLKADDYILGFNCHFENVYEDLPISKTTLKNIKRITALMVPLSRPNESIKEKHIEQIRSRFARFKSTS